MALMTRLTTRIMCLSSLLVIAMSAVSTEAFFVTPSVNQHRLVGIGQRNVAAAAATTLSTTTSFLTMRVGKRSRSNRGDGRLAVINAERIAAAGRPGTKKFIDPCKVFCGNLPFDADEDDLRGFFKKNLGHDLNVKSVKVIRDWKTGNSKGYGFCLFTDPMFATAAMEFCKNKKLMGRIVTLNQGKKKLDENELYIKKKKKAPVDGEEAAIVAGLERAELDLSKVIELDGFDTDDDDELFGSEDDDDFEFDGVFEEEYPEDPNTVDDTSMNREQRREAAKRRPRRKLPHKGFESQPEWEFESDETKNQQPDWVEPM